MEVAMSSRVSSLTEKNLSRRKLIGNAAKLGAGVAAAPLVANHFTRSASAATKISMMGWGSPLEKENVDKGLKTFQASHPDIEVEWIHVPEDYDTKLKTSLAGGSPPDVFWSTNPRDYIARGVALDVTANITADPTLGAPDYFIQPQEKNRSTVNDKWYGIGSCWVLTHLYYNVELFEKAGIDPPSADPANAWTWDQFLDVSRRLTFDSSGKNPDQEGFSVDDTQQWGTFWPTYYIQRDAMILSNGGTNYTDAYECKYGEPAAIEALQAVADLTTKHHVAPLGAMATQLGMDQNQMLASGKVAMLADGSWALLDIAKMGFKFGCAVLPKMKEPVTGSLAHLHMIQKKTEQPDAAWQLLAYLSSDDYQRGLCQVGLWLPSHTSLISTDGLATWITAGVHPDGYDLIASKYLRENSQSYYYPAGFQEADQLVTSALDPVWIGDKTVDEAINGSSLIADVNKVLAESKERLDANA
jgi:multiple sugar transport system substrate-binding protein